MANGQPMILGGVNSATLPTAVGTPSSDAFVAGTSAGGITAIIGFGPRVGTGVFGTAQPMGPNLISSDVGVFGDAQSTGVFGRGKSGMVTESDGRLIATSSGVTGLCNAGVGVFGVATSGFGAVGRSVIGVGVAGESSSAPGVSGTSQTSQGVFGTSTSSAGVVGKSTSGSGVRGRSTTGIGVYGESDASMGVYGYAKTDAGVRGDSDKSTGVSGISDAGYGVTGWSVAGNAGVAGYSQKKVGVRGSSLDGVGVFAESAVGSGVIGWQTANTTVAVAGVAGVAETGIGVIAYGNNGIGLYAKSRASLAARFDGPVDVYGSFRVVGGTKSAVVRHRDGTHRQLYCVESPESWFEDFGEARLVKGVAKVKLDSEFAALIDTARYQVFLTCYDPVQLYVHKRTRQGFEIRVLPGADGRLPKSARCGYRIVARRKDISAPRLAKVKLAKPPAQLPLPKLREMKMTTALKRKIKAEPIPDLANLPPAPKVPDVSLPEKPVTDSEVEQR